MNDIYVFPVKAIKGILQKELDSFKDGFFQLYPNVIMSDMQKEIIHIGYGHLKNKLDKCTTYKDIEEYLTYCGYRMSLKDWIESL